MEYKVTTRKEYYEFAKDQHQVFIECRQDMAAGGGEEIDEGSMAYEIADSILSFNHEIKEFMMNEMGIRDPIGRLADDIACGV